MIQIYNQMLSYFTRNGCTIYTLFGIVSDQWGLIFLNNEIIKTLQVAKEDKVWYEAWGAYFSKIYNWFVGYTYSMFLLKLKVEKVDIMSNEFERMIDEGYSFGLGLKKANSTYSNVVADGVFSEEDVDKLLNSKGGTGHNHRYCNYEIRDSLNLKDNTIKTSLGALRKAVRLGLYYPTARTLVTVGIRTSTIGSYLKILTFKPNENIKPETKFEKECLDQAGNLFLQYKAGRS